MDSRYKCCVQAYAQELRLSNPNLVAWQGNLFEASNFISSMHQGKAGSYMIYLREYSNPYCQYCIRSTLFPSVT